MWLKPPVGDPCAQLCLHHKLNGCSPRTANVSGSEPSGYCLMSWGSKPLQARIRNMTWHALPAASARRQENTSVYDNGKKRLFWRVEWHFQAASMVVTDE